MYYACAVDLTTLITLSSIASEQARVTTITEQHIAQLLDYLHTHKDATIRYVVSDMILNIHSDASYLSEPQAENLLIFREKLMRSRGAKGGCTCVFDCVCDECNGNTTDNSLGSCLCCCGNMGDGKDHGDCDGCFDRWFCCNFKL